MSLPAYFLSDGISSRPIERDEVRIGRGEECDIRLADHRISRQHCLLSKEGQSLVLRDLNSINGTFVNGKRVTFAKLSIGDYVKLGKSGFVVEDNAYSSVWERLKAFSSAQAFSRSISKSS